MLPALISTIASTGNSCSDETERRMASMTGSNDALVAMPAAFDLVHDDQPLAAFTSTVNAAPAPRGGLDGCARRWLRCPADSG